MIPTCPYDGNRPMAKVAPPIRLTVARKVALRPTRSPIAPKMIAPNGRKAKPTANKASAAISAEVGSSPVRNTLAITGVSEPKMKKSYHSNAVPADEAVITRAIDHGFATVSSFIPGSPWAQGIAARHDTARGRGARRSVDLGDHLLDARNGQAELAHRHAVGE